MKDVFVVEAARTAVARSGKHSWFNNIRADELSAIVFKELRRRCGLEDPARQNIIEDVVWAATANAYMEQGLNIGRLAWILSGGAYEVPGCTFDRLCGSSLNSIQYAISTMMTGMGGDVMIAGGCQNMTHVPMGAGSDIHPDLGKYMAIGAINMGYSAEVVARRFDISREEQDRYAVQSHQKCAAAQAANKTGGVIIPIRTMVTQRSLQNPNPFGADAAYTASCHLADAVAEKGDYLVEAIIARDQGVRADTTMESLAAMPTYFMQDDRATVTAGNSSQINDGAAGLVLATSEGVRALDRKPIMKMISYAVVGLAPEIMGIGPSLAIPRALKRAGLLAKQIDLWEINEAFAAPIIYVKNILDIDQNRLNVWGSGISIGHPLACTGARIAVDIAAMLADTDFADVEYVVESMCVGHGQAVAVVWQRVI